MRESSVSGRMTDRQREQVESPTVVRRTFEEVPGENEAEAVQAAFLAPVKTDFSPSLGPEGRAGTAMRMQSVLGNQFVQRAIGRSLRPQGELVGESQSDMVAEVQRRADSGEALPSDTRTRLESFSGADLADVRLHTGSDARTLTRDLSADAFTVGQDIFVAPHMYSPHTAQGEALLAHEVTHVAQQSSGEAVQRAVATVEAPDSGDEEAEKKEELAKGQQDQGADGTASVPPPPPGAPGSASDAPQGPPPPPSSPSDAVASPPADATPNVPKEGVQIGSAFDAAAGAPAQPPPLPSVDGVIPQAPEAPTPPPPSEGAAAAIGLAAGGAAGIATEVGVDLATQTVAGAVSGLDAARSVGAALAGGGVTFAPSAAEAGGDSASVAVAQTQHQQAEALAAEFVASNTARVDGMLAAAAAIPDQLSAAAGAAKASIGAAVEQQCGELSAQIAAQRAAAEARATEAQAAIEAQYAAAVPALQAITASARDRIQAAHTAALGQLDQQVVAQNARIEQLYSDADPKFRATGPKVGDEAVAPAEAAAQEYLSHRIFREDGFWDGHLTDRKCEARADAARSVGKSYKEELTKTANEQADKAQAGKATDLNHVTEAATKCRETLTTQLNAAMDGLTQFEASVLSAAGQAHANLLQAVDANLTATLNGLATQEAAQVQALAEQGERQKAGVDRDAGQASASLMDGATQAAAAVHDSLNQFVTAAAAAQAPDASRLSAFLAEAQNSLSGLIAQFSQELDAQRVGSEQQFAESASQSADIFSQLAQSGTQQAADIGDQFNAGMAGMVQSADEVFVQVQQSYASSADTAVGSATDGFSQVNQGVQQLFDNVGHNLETGFTQAEQGLEDGLRAALTKDDALNKAIRENAEKAADQVQPWWKSVLKWVLIIAVVLVVALVVGPAVIGFVGGLAAGALGVAATSLTATIIGGVVGGAIVGAASSAVIQIGSNLIDGVHSFGDAFKGVGRAMAIGAIGGAIGGLGGAGAQLIGRGVEAGALTFAQTAGRFAIGQVFGVGGGAFGEFLVTGHVEVTGLLVGAAIGVAASGLIHGVPGIGKFSQGIQTSATDAGFSAGGGVVEPLPPAPPTTTGGSDNTGTGTGTGTTQPGPVAAEPSRWVQFPDGRVVELAPADVPAGAAKGDVITTPEGPARVVSEPGQLPNAADVGHPRPADLSGGPRWVQFPDGRIVEMAPGDVPAGAATGDVVQTPQGPAKVVTDEGQLPSAQDVDHTLPAPEAEPDVPTGPETTFKKGSDTPPPGGYFPEANLEGSGKHGLNWTEGRARAIKTGDPQGQFGSQADIDVAVARAADLGPGGWGIFDLPAGNQSIVHMPDGSVVPATKVFVKVYPSGKVHAYPLP